jgi:hypothetical protein
MAKTGSWKLPGREHQGYFVAILSEIERKQPILSERSEFISCSKMSLEVQK